MYKTKATSLLENIYNFRLGRKTRLISYFSIASLAIVVGWGGFILRQSLIDKQLKEVESLLSITNSKYNSYFDAVSLGFRGQSDNTAIITAAQNHVNGQQISANLRQQIKTIFRNEIKARGIEYATLVGKDKRIIVNANKERVGQNFDPQGLVSKSLKTSQLITTTEILPWNELIQENPSLPEGFKEDSLVRFTIVPVKDINNKETLGVLVAGDIINKKPLFSKK